MRTNHVRSRTYNSVFVKYAFTYFVRYSFRYYWKKLRYEIPHDSSIPAWQGALLGIYEGLHSYLASGPRDLREFHQSLNRCCYTTFKQANASFLVQLCLCCITYIYAANKVTLRTQMKHGRISRNCWLSLSSLRQHLLVFAATLTRQDPPTSNSPWHLMYPVSRSWTCNTSNTSHTTFISTIHFRLYKPLNVKSDVFWNEMPCYWADAYQRFGRTCCVHLHGRCYPRIFLIGFPSFRVPQDLHTAPRTRPFRNREKCAFRRYFALCGRPHDSDLGRSLKLGREY